MNDENKINPRVFFARKDKEGKRFASGEWDDGTKVYMKNFRETTDGVIADVDYQTDEQYENKQGNLVYRHKICGALSLSPTKAVLVIELNGKKERLVCTPRQVLSKKTQEPMVVMDFGDGATNNPYIDDLNAEPKQVDVDSIDQLVDDSLPF